MPLDSHIGLLILDFCQINFWGGVDSETSNSILNLALICHFGI